MHCWSLYIYNLYVYFDFGPGLTPARKIIKPVVYVIFFSELRKGTFKKPRCSFLWGDSSNSNQQPTTTTTCQVAAFRSWNVLQQESGVTMIRACSCCESIDRAWRANCKSFKRCMNEKWQRWRWEWSGVIRLPILGKCKQIDGHLKWFTLKSEFIVFVGNRMTPCWRLVVESGFFPRNQEVKPGLCGEICCWSVWSHLFFTPLTMFYQTTGKDGVWYYYDWHLIWHCNTWWAFIDCRQWNKSGKKQQQNVKGVGSSWEDFPTKKGPRRWFPAVV